MSVQLIAIEESGALARPLSSCPDLIKQNCQATAEFYKVIGFAPPWIGYVSLNEGRNVGGGAFKGPPRNNRVEIARERCSIQKTEKFGSGT